MCGLVVSKKRGNNKYIRYRGEEVHSTKINGLTFTHTLLPITGEPTKQPFREDDIVCLYNGEIYNQPFVKSDGECLIPLYKRCGINFVKYLDGEYAIALYDFGNDLAVFITDPFATKPLWVNGIECASYESGVGGKEVPPNTMMGIKISSERKLFETNHHKWSWHQNKDTYDDWLNAFSNAVKKRAKDGCFLGLSSGYDSGAISKELTKQGVKFKAYTVPNNENGKIIGERSKYCYEFEKVYPNLKEMDDLIKKRVEEVPYKVAAEALLTEDTASLGLAAICQRAKREGRKVYLSGQGADEIIGDYKFYPKQSNFKGVFPNKLEQWENFTNGIQRDYIHKEEYIGGAFGIETRYPFLDKDVVQEFLWLTPRLKNKNYKAPIYDYLVRNRVPFEKNVKRGFRP